LIYCFSEILTSLPDISKARRAGRGFGVEDRDGSEMAPQGVENAKNGLGNGEPPAQCLMIRLRNLSFRRASAQGPCNQAQEAEKVARKRT
jgi:hypothetical protein